MRKVLDIFFTSLIYTLTFFISYQILHFFKIVPDIYWYIYFLIGFLNSIFFKLFGLIIGVKNVR